MTTAEPGTDRPGPAGLARTAEADLPGLDLAAVDAWAAGRLPGRDGPLTATVVAGGRSNLTYLLADDGGPRWVLRRPPLGLLAPSAHDMAREFRVVAALAGTAVPVAPAVALCEDRSVLGVPFAVHGYVPGRTVQSADDAAALTRAEQAEVAERLVEALAALHAVDPRAVGLADLGRPDGYLERQVRRWRAQWDVVGTHDPALVDALAARLRAALPAGGRTAVVHGDYRLDNLLLGGGTAGGGGPVRVLAVVDWELSTLGDPLADLGLALAYWDPLSEAVLGVPHVRGVPNGFGSGDALAARYAALTGADLADLPFHRALGCYKLAVIAEGLHHRHLAGDTVGDGFATAGAAVEPLLRRGLELAP